MKNQLLCSRDESRITTEEDEEYHTRSIAPKSYCWWRSGAKIDDMYETVKHNCSGKAAAAAARRRMGVVRELERLALVATHHTGMNDLRHKLLMYRSGDFWMPTGGITKESTDIPPLATILLIGFSASGKTSLVNLMYSVLGRSALLIPFAKPSTSTSSSMMMPLKEHNVLRSLRSGFCVFDSRGFEYHQIQMPDDQHNGVEELVSSWISDGVQHNQVCSLIPGDGANLLLQHDDHHCHLKSPSKFVTRRVNCVMMVVNMAEIYKAFEAGDSKPMEATRQLFCSIHNAFRNSSDADDQNPILILTHGDMLSTEERIEGRLKICECLGVSETSGVYDIVCPTEYGFQTEESDPVSAYSLTEAVYRALLLSDRSHSPKKNALDWAMLISTLIMCFLASVFAFLARVCIKLGRPHTSN